MESLERAEELGAAGRARAERLFDLRRSRERYRELVPAGPAADGEGIALVTVSHDSELELPALLRSAGAHLPGAHVIVVDSGSGDRSVEIARTHGAEVIELGENAGYGRASNAGVAAVREPVTVLVNPDVELLDGSLARLARELTFGRGGPDRLLAPLMLLPDGSRQDAAQAEPGGAAALAIALVPPVAMPPAAAARRLPLDERRAAPGGLGGGGLPGGPHRARCAASARSTSASSCTARTSSWGCAQPTWGSRPGSGPTPACSTTAPAARRARSAASRSSCSPSSGAPWCASAAAAPGRRCDDLLQAATFADRIALKSLARRDTTREREQLRALRRARRSR